MKDSTLLLLTGGAAAAGYYFLVLKPKTDVESAFAGGAGAISAIPSAVGDTLGGLVSGLQGFINGLLPNVQAAPTPIPQAITTPPQIAVLPAPIGKLYGLTIQQPTATAGLSQTALASLTTLGDITRIRANKAAEVAIKAQEPGNLIVGHRTQGGVEIYTLKNKATGAITIVRK